MGGACSLHNEDEKILQYLLRERDGREHMENSCVDECVAVM